MIDAAFCDFQTCLKLCNGAFVHRIQNALHCSTQDMEFDTTCIVLGSHRETICKEMYILMQK